MNKRILTTIVAAMFVVASALSVYAFGPGGGFGPGAGYGPSGGNFGNVQGTPMTQEQIDKLNKYRMDVLPLQQKMIKLKTELAVLNSQAKPDYKAIADKQKEMVDIRIEIQKKANEAGIPAFSQGRGLGKGMGACGCMGSAIGPAGYKKSGMRGPGAGFRL